MKDLRTFMAECEKKLPQEFVRVTQQVDPKYEISAIIKKLDLRKPVFRRTAAYGHFGNPAFRWEKLDMVAKLKKDAGI